MSTWILEIVESFTVKQGGHVVTWAPGQRMMLSPEKAQRVMDRVGSKVRVVDHEFLDPLIGTVVEAPLEFLRVVNEGEETETTERVRKAGPWIVADVVTVDRVPGVLTGRWLLLTHGPAWRWNHESTTAPYRCPKCAGPRCWWSEHTVLCAQCIPSTCPQWRTLWREVAELSGGIAADDPRYPAVWDTVQRCDEAFKAGDYAEFQMGVVRMRRAALEPSTFSGGK